MATSYDQVYYHTQPVRMSHPVRLAGRAWFEGGAPRNPAESRILELGCGDGNNLIPIALSYPHSFCKGVDLSERQISAGKALITRLRAPNIELCAADITTPESINGEFDYILCHGVFSWVSHSIQERIFEVCQNHLSPDGVAYISYNTYPGWHIRQLIREAMLTRVDKDEAPAVQVAKARSFIRFLMSHLRSEDGHDVTLLKREMAVVSELPDWYLFHDFLEEFNQPCYFREFVGRASSHGLTYLGDADQTKSIPQEFPRAVESNLSTSRDNLAREETLDFLRLRMFRRSLLAKRRQGESRGAKGLERCYLAANVVSQRPNGTESDGASESFQTANGGVLSTSDPLLREAMRHLGSNWPKAVAWGELVAHSGKPLSPQEEDSLQHGIYRCYLAQMIEAVPFPFPATASLISERPKASLLARVQSTTREEVTNFLHEEVPVSGIVRHLLPLLDGSRSQEEVVRELERTMGASRAQCDEALSYLLKNALLEA